MKGQNEGQGRRSRGLWAAGSVIFLATLIVWQGVQVWKLGVLGVPWLFTMQLSSHQPMTTDIDAPFAGGVTVVAKTLPSKAKEPALEQKLPPGLKSAIEPNSAAEPVPNLRANVAPIPVAQPRLRKQQWQQQADLVEASPPEAEGAAVVLPSEGEIRGWIKSEAEEAVGGVDEEGMPLYRFALWLEPPQPVQQKIASVAYNFDAPSAKPKSQASTTRESGFRVKFGGASCARTVIVIVTLEDGRSQMAEVDGCAILN